MRGKHTHGFSEDDLYSIWLNCRENENVVTIMSDFMVSTKAEAKKLINQFELRYECNILNDESRGKADRIRKHI